MAALNALQASNASVVGIGQDVNADARTFRIPYNLVFGADIEQLFSAIYNEDDKSYALHIDRDGPVGNVIERTVFRTQAEQDRIDTLPVLVPGRTYTTRVQSLVAGMNLLDGTLTPTYAHRGQISLLGSGEERTAPEGYEAVTATNPISGRTFVAFRKTGDTTPGAWYAADVLQKANEIATREGATEAEIENAFGDVELVRLAFSILGN
jgi:hypothetical protein